MMDKVITHVRHILSAKSRCCLAFLGLFMATSVLLHAQQKEKISAADSLLFRQYLHIKMPLYTDVVLLQNYYYYLNVEKRRGELRKDNSETYNMRGNTTENVYDMPRHDDLSPFVFGAMTKPFDEIRNELKAQFERTHRDQAQFERSKRDLVERLTAFGEKAKVKPIFFVDIETDFNGDVARYVEHLYSHSIMGSEKMFKKFMRKPSKEKIQQDPGFQFTLGLLLYEKTLQGM